MRDQFFGLMAGLNILASAIGFSLDLNYDGALLGANGLVFAVCLGLSKHDKNKARATSLKVEENRP